MVVTQPLASWKDRCFVFVKQVQQIFSQELHSKDRIKPERGCQIVDMWACDGAAQTTWRLGLSLGWKLRMELEAGFTKPAFNSVDEKKVDGLPRAVRSLIFIRAWPQLQFKRTENGEKKDIWSIDNVKEILTPSWNSLKILAENSQICEMNTNDSSFPPQPARPASVLITRRTRLSTCLTDRTFGAVAASAPTKKNVVAQTTAVTSPPTLHAACVCSHPGHQLLGYSFPLGGATGHWEDF